MMLDLNMSRNTSPVSLTKEVVDQIPAISLMMYYRNSKSF